MRRSLRHDIAVEGHLEPSHAMWRGGLSLQREFQRERPIPRSSGTLADQAALDGVLDKLRDMGLRDMGVVPLEVRLEPSA